MSTERSMATIVRFFAGSLVAAAFILPGCSDTSPKEPQMDTLAKRVACEWTIPPSATPPSPGDKSLVRNGRFRRGRLSSSDGIWELDCPAIPTSHLSSDRATLVIEAGGQITQFALMSENSLLLAAFDPMKKRTFGGYELHVEPDSESKRRFETCFVARPLLVTISKGGVVHRFREHETRKIDGIIVRLAECESRSSVACPHVPAGTCGWPDHSCYLLMYMAP